MTMTDWIRPWYPDGATGHIYPDCEHLLRTEPTPQEGAGWLNPDGERVCEDCLKRHNPAALSPPWDAVCDTCDASMSEEEDDSRSEDDAKFWRDNHECEPEVRLIRPQPAQAPATPLPASVPDGQQPLFDLQDAA